MAPRNTFPTDKTNDIDSSPELGFVGLKHAVRFVSISKLLNKRMKTPAQNRDVHFRLGNLGPWGFLDPHLTHDV